MKTQVEHIHRPKGRAPVWSLKVSNEEVLFGDRWVSVKFMSESAALWFAQVVEQLHSYEIKINHRSQLSWSGNIDDDCSYSDNTYSAHAEHLEGPLGKGGMWYCSLEKDGQQIFHSSDFQLQIRSSEAARWLCETLMQAVKFGVGLGHQ